MSADRITPAQFDESDGIGDWRVFSEGACAFFRTGSLAAGARFVSAISAMPGLDEHHPEVDLRHDGVTVRLITAEGNYRGMSRRDVELARAISALAREQGVAADPAAVQTMLIIPGAPNIAEVMPFWRAVLGYVPAPRQPRRGPHRPAQIGAAFWFEQMDEPRADGGGAIHLAIWVPREQAEARIEAALAAGGRMVRDDFAPAWWTLADAAGNEADIATTTSRA